MMGQPVAFFTVNGTKRHGQAPVPRPGDTRTSAQQFWTERLQTLKRHLESTQASDSEPEPSGRPVAEDGG